MHVVELGHRVCSAGLSRPRGNDPVENRKSLSQKNRLRFRLGRRGQRRSSSSSIILRRWVIGHLLVTPPYRFISFTPLLLLTPGTRKRPPQSGFVVCWACSTAWR